MTQTRKLFLLYLLIIFHSVSQRKKGFDLDYPTVPLPCYREKVKIVLQSYGIQTVQSAMKYFSSRVGLCSFVAVFVLGFVFQGDFAMEDLRHEDEVAEKHLLRLDKRSVSKNATPNMPDILKQLKTLEEK